MTTDLLWLALIGLAGFSVASAAQAATGFGIAERAHIERRTAVRFLVASLVGMPMGLLLLTSTGMNGPPLVVAAGLRSRPPCAARDAAGGLRGPGPRRPLGAHPPRAGPAVSVTPASS